MRSTRTHHDPSFNDPHFHVQTVCILHWNLLRGKHTRLLDSTIPSLCWTGLVQQCTGQHPTCPHFGVTDCTVCKPVQILGRQTAQSVMCPEFGMTDCAVCDVSRFWDDRLHSLQQVQILGCQIAQCAMCPKFGVTDCTICNMFRFWGDRLHSPQHVQIWG